jgi:hypothetical protein
MKWITRENIKVDRVACPWLIPHFVDADAEFVFLPADTDWSKIDNGAVFDVPKCELGHHGEDVSFNSILKKYRLGDPALALLGEIVRQLTRIRAIRIQPVKVCAGSRTASAQSILPITKFSSGNLSFTTRFIESANGRSQNARRPRSKRLARKPRCLLYLKF